MIEIQQRIRIDTETPKMILARVYPPAGGPAIVSRELFCRFGQNVVVTQHDKETSALTS